MNITNAMSVIYMVEFNSNDGNTVGTHDLNFVYEDGEVSTRFKVAEATNKKDKIIEKN